MGAVSTSAESLLMSTSSSSSGAVTSVGHFNTLSTTNRLPESLLHDYMTSCKHGFSGRLYRMERKYVDGQDAASHAGLILMDALLHPFNQFACIQIRLQGKRLDGVGFTAGKKQMLFETLCFTLDPHFLPKSLRTLDMGRDFNRPLQRSPDVRGRLQPAIDRRSAPSEPGDVDPNFF